MLGEPRVASGNKTAAGNFVGEKCPQLSAEIFGCGRKGGGRKGKASHASIVAEITSYGPGGLMDSLWTGWRPTGLDSDVVKRT